MSVPGMPLTMMSTTDGRVVACRRRPCRFGPVPPSPSLPWHHAHCASKMRRPAERSFGPAAAADRACAKAVSGSSTRQPACTRTRTRRLMRRIIRRLRAPRPYDATTYLHSLNQRGDHRIFLGCNRAQVEHDAIALDARDDGRCEATELTFETGRGETVACDRDQPRRQLDSRSGAAADGGRAGDDLRPPSVN